MALNNAGQLLTTTAGPYYGSFLSAIYNTSTGSTQVVPALPNTFQSWPMGINNAGQVIGNTFVSPDGTFNSGYWSHPFLATNGKAIDLGTLGGDYASANGINDKGQVVGSSELTNNLVMHAFLYANGKMVDLGSLPGLPNSSASSINAQGQIVGYGYSASGTSWTAFIYQNGVMTDLNTLIDPKSGLTINFAQSINNLGQILALASNGSEVLLTPSNLATPGEPQYVTITPEPGSLAVFGVMISALVVRLRSRRNARARWEAAGQSPLT